MLLILVLKILFWRALSLNHCKNNQIFLLIGTIKDVFSIFLIIFAERFAHERA